MKLSTALLMGLLLIVALSGFSCTTTTTGATDNTALIISLEAVSLGCDEAVAFLGPLNDGVPWLKLAASWADSSATELSSTDAVGVQLGKIVDTGSALLVQQLASPSSEAKVLAIVAGVKGVIAIVTSLQSRGQLVGHYTMYAMASRSYPLNSKDKASIVHIHKVFAQTQKRGG